MERWDLKILNILQLGLFGKMISICPKCESEYKEIDNFCIECGKDLRIIKIKNSKKKHKKRNRF
jgi:predicted amidophosphoribosyltransferase